jgi:hypothetical protein
MKPVVSRDARVVSVLEGGALELVTDGGAVVLAPLEAAVWQAADGSREVAQLAEIASGALGQTVEAWEVWSALDVLADHGLMAAQSAPPAVMGRRDALRWMGQAAGAAALLVMGARTASAQDKAAAEAVEAEEVDPELEVPEDAKPLPADAPAAKKRVEAEAKTRHESSMKAMKKKRSEESYKSEDRALLKKKANAEMHAKAQKSDARSEEQMKER